ncbi:class C beta-lactamase-related serine hydrolase [Hwanghaeella grinnelliae]|uniref:Class C beta-lactamase-related serine hydrolase n=1 Tax=Hwanghaeella grinnelliae TaxID=2500179 RepID=A0A437QVU4_9PROT|nr:serine hydrolase [Hwanghaeella grinnelliae]RVU38618.1 class C beta-lactamase-related serine hydrolase [Hwanghaeella grinnelliae]
MTGLETFPNPDLVVGDDHKQQWMRAAFRRNGFHNADRLFRRARSFRAARVLALEESYCPKLMGLDATRRLSEQPYLSALVVARGNEILLEVRAPDFPVSQTHSIQSVTKLHIHLMVGWLIAEGRIDPTLPVSRVLPDIGDGYRHVTVQDLLDMQVVNDFSEDYSDPNADCYREEVALGWRLPPQGESESGLSDFAHGIGGAGVRAGDGVVHYKSVNTDVLTLICSQVSPVPLEQLIEAVVSAAGYEGAFHISISPDGYPAFSGGGCLTARDAVRLGLLFARWGAGPDGSTMFNGAFLRKSIERSAPRFKPPRQHVRYSNHLMTNGVWVGHAGYGGQFVMADPNRGVAAAFLSVLDNESGYDERYMENVVRDLDTVISSVGA